MAIMIVGLSILFHLVSGATLDIELEIFDSTPALLYKSTLAGMWNSLHHMEGIPLADPGMCPPRHINTSAGEIIPRTRPIATGSGTQIRVSRDHLWVVKTLVGEGMEFRDMFNDMAYCTVFHPDGVAPKVARILRTPEMDPHCRVRTMISAFEGYYQVKTLPDRFSSRTHRAQLSARVTVRALELLARVHAGGFVHGDIHYENFVFGPVPSGEGHFPDPEEAVESVALIDFGRASPFITDEGHHTDKENTSYGVGWNSAFLSPFELDGGTKTRRDDIFRLAEMALQLLGPDDQFIRFLEVVVLGVGIDVQRKRLAKLKRTRKLGDNVPGVFRDFYKYSLDLKFNEKPDYERWMMAFSEQWT